MSRNRGRGFTLIELIIVVAIMGILSAIAYPMYQDQVRKSRRGAVKGALMQMSQFMERNYTESLRYDQDAAGNAININAILNDPLFAEHRADMEEHYTLNFAVVSGVYTITAAPKAGQDHDVCGSLSLSGNGSKSADHAGCW